MPPPAAPALSPLANQEPSATSSGKPVSPTWPPARRVAVYELPDREACTRWLRDVAPPITDLIADQPASIQDALWDRVTDAWAPFEGDDGRVRLPCTAIWASGTNPDSSGAP